MAFLAGSADAQGQCDPLRNSRRHRGHDGQSIEDLAALSISSILEEDSSLFRLLVNTEPLLGSIASTPAGRRRPI